ncbi:MAG: amidohydrolase [Clostridia bacterium]|nr:amidohydrolase [Clostridia bacterium]
MKIIHDAVDKHRSLIFDAERYIWKNPETGFKEYKTTAYLAEKFTALGYELTYADGITGFYTTFDTGKKGPTVLVLGELDSIICPSHPESDPVTGAVHSCGHNAQCAALLGLAAALKEPGVTDGLCGKIKLCAVPAEELLEIEFRSKLIEQGKIKYYGGKTEFLRRGYFKDVDLAFMVHTNTADVFKALKKGAIGCIAKRIIYKGVAAHAGGSPHKGKNAFYAATCGINACNALRETFEEKDLIRFHPIMTHGGSMVNAIPERAEIETYVRGKTFEGMLKNSKRLNQALIGAALSLDNNIEIIDRAGYAPLLNDANLVDIAESSYKQMFPDKEFMISDVVNTGSTDMGDLSMVMPAIHPYACGAKGTSHGNDYYIVDPEKACVDSAKWQLNMLVNLLKDNGALAYKVISENKPTFESQQAYLDFMDSIAYDGDRIIYSEGKAEIKL